MSAEQSIYCNVLNFLWCYSPSPSSQSSSSNCGEPSSGSLHCRLNLPISVVDTFGTHIYHTVVRLEYCCFRMLINVEYKDYPVQQLKEPKTEHSWVRPIVPGPTKVLKPRIFSSSHGSVDEEW